MARKERTFTSAREEKLRTGLTHERNIEIARIQDFRRDQMQSKLNSPGDELEVAKSLADEELHANLIERSEDRLKAIDAALNQLELGTYGTCQQCSNDISLERLQALPFATSCIECQSQSERGRQKGGNGQPFGHRWTPPAEMQENTRDEVPDAPEDDLSVRQSAFGPDDEELEAMEQSTAPRRRGRPRKVALARAS